MQPRMVTVTMLPPTRVVGGLDRTCSKKHCFSNSIFGTCFEYCLQYNTQNILKTYSKHTIGNSVTMCPKKKILWVWTVTICNHPKILWLGTVPSWPHTKCSKNTPCTLWPHAMYLTKYSQYPFGRIQNTKKVLIVTKNILQKYF